MTTNTFYGNDCGCAPVLGTGQSLKEIGQNLLCSLHINDFIQRLWMAITRRWASLVSFDNAVGGAWITASQEKTYEFDNQVQARHEEARARLFNLALANVRDRDLPDEDLSELDSRYLVRSEDYRISVGQGMGQQYIDAETTRMHNEKMWF